MVIFSAEDKDAHAIDPLPLSWPSVQGVPVKVWRSLPSEATSALDP